MDSPLSRIFEEPILLAAAIFLIGLVVYSVLKKLLRVALIFAIGFVALVGYYAYTGKEPPPALQEMKDEAGAKLEQGIEAGKRKAQEAGAALGREVKKATKEAIDDATESLGGGS